MYSGDGEETEDGNADKQKENERRDEANSKQAPSGKERPLGR